MTTPNANQNAARRLIGYRKRPVQGLGAAMMDRDGNVTVRSDLAKLKSGQRVDQIITWAWDELDGFAR